MDKNINCIMLVDDNKIDNFFHTRVITKHGAVKTIIEKTSGEEGLEYLKNKEINNGIHPEVIFLDINMPGMNGWDFIEEYSQLDKELQSKMVVIMLSTSENPDDVALAKTKNILADFRTKPLTKTMLDEILDKVAKPI